MLLMRSSRPRARYGRCSAPLPRRRVVSGASPAGPRLPTPTSPETARCSRRGEAAACARRRQGLAPPSTGPCPPQRARRAVARVCLAQALREGVSSRVARGGVCLQAVEDIVARLRSDCDVAQEIERVTSPPPLLCPAISDIACLALDPVHCSRPPSGAED